MYRTVHILFKQDIETGEETVVRVFDTVESALESLEIDIVYPTDLGMAVSLTGNDRDRPDGWITGKSYAYPFSVFPGFRVRLWDPIKHAHAMLALRQWEVH